jgi:hypothetical protein
MIHFISPLFSRQTAHRSHNADRYQHLQQQQHPSRGMDTSAIENNSLSQSINTHTHVLPAHYASYGDRLRRLSDQTARIERAAEDANLSTKELTRDDKDDLIIAMQVQKTTCSSQPISR